MKNTILLTLSLLAMCCPAADAQHKTAGQPKLVKTQHSGYYDDVCRIVQTRNGDLWIGTSADGAYYYDGKTFTNFNKTNGPGSNAICSIIEDREGRIWMAGGAGVYRYDGKTFTNIPFTTAGNNNFAVGIPQLNDPNDRITPSAMIQDRNGKIWLGTGRGVYYYNGTSFAPFLDGSVINKGNLKLTMAQSIIEDKKGNIWFTTWFDGLCRYDGKELVNFKPNGEVWFAGLLEDSKGNIWVGRRSNGICRYDGNTFTNIVQGGTLDSSAIMSIAEDGAGNIWFGAEADDMTKRETAGGAWRYDGKTFTNYLKKDGLPHCAVFSIMADKNGDVWIGTRNTGLCRYDGKRFVRY